MPAVKMWQIHYTLDKAIDYILDENKTGELTFVSSNKCIPEIADKQFLLNDLAAKDKFGEKINNEGNGRPVLAHHIIQSFKPGEITPEHANEIGMELCRRVFGEDYQFIVATHLDKNHIHNHIIVNPRNVNTLKKMSVKKGTLEHIRRESDKICIDNGIDIIEKKTRRSFVNYKDWMAQNGEYDKDSNRKILRENIDAAIEISSSWSMFLSRMNDAGYIIKTKTKSGEWLKNIAYRGNGAKRFIREDTLGEGYTRKEIITRINERNKAAKIKKELATGNGYQVITINIATLVQYHEGNEIFTRLPGMYDKYFIFDKSKIRFEYLHNGKTIKLYIPKNMDMPIYNKNKILISHMNSNDLFNYYNDVQQKLKDMQKLSSITNCNKQISFGIDRRIKLMMKQTPQFKAQTLVNVINNSIMEGIHVLSDYDKKISYYQSIINSLNNTELSLKNKIQECRDLLKYVDVRDKYEEVYRTYINKNKNTEFYYKFKTEIDSYEVAVNELDKVNLNYATDFVVNSLEEIINKNQALVYDNNNKIAELEEKMEKLNYDKTVSTSILVTKANVADIEREYERELEIEERQRATAKKER